jgi:hypothetical protein
MPGGFASAVRGLIRALAFGLLDRFIEPPAPARPVLRTPVVPVAAPSLAAAATVPGRAAVGQALAAADRVAAERGLVVTPAGRTLLGLLAGGGYAATVVPAVPGTAPATRRPVGYAEPLPTAGVGSDNNHLEGGPR